MYTYMATMLFMCKLCMYCIVNLLPCTPMHDDDNIIIISVFMHNTLVDHALYEYMYMMGNL